MISVVLHSDCFKSTTNCRDSAFSLRGLEAGLPAFQLPMFSKCDALPKGERFVWHVCLRNPFPLFLLGIPSIHSQPEAGFWEPQYVPPGLHYGCIMPIPSLQLKIKTSLMQRSKGFGHGVVVSKICYVIYSDCVQDLDYRILIVLSVVTRGCCKPMNNCRDWAFRNIGLEVWLPAFQPPMFSKCDTAERREICLTCLSKKSIPAIPFWISKPPIPPRSRFLRAAVRSTRSALCLHHAHPFVAAEDKNQSHAEKQRVWSRSCGLQDLLQCIDCALNCAMWLLQTNERLSRLSF